MKNEQPENFSAIMSRFIQKISAMDRTEKVCYGVTTTQANVINTLQRREAVTMNELSTELGLAISTLTRIVDVLVRDNIVCRKQCHEDRRRVFISLTEKGNHLADLLQECSRNFWQKIFDEVPDEKKQLVSESLEMLFNILEKIGSVCCPPGK